MTTPILSQLFIYPVKSLTGIAVNQWQVSETGLLYDRKWMLIDANNHFLSQRTLPRMALIQTALTDDSLIFSAPQMTDMAIPLQPEGGEQVLSQIWQDACWAQAVSSEVDQWFGAFLKIPCRLVYQPQQAIRPVDPQYAGVTDQVSFADGFPFLVVSEASLTALNQAMGLELRMERFRPNLVFENCAPYSEDSWREICIAGIHFTLPKPCSRCAVPTIDPQTGMTGKEPLATLNKLRKWQNKVYFGQNALHDRVGLLACGDAVTLLRVGHPQPLLS